MILALLACATMTPPVSVPTDVNVVKAPAPVIPPGSLWSEVGTRALIGADGNARRVGDLITVKIEDTSTTSLGADTSTSRVADSTYGIGATIGLQEKLSKANPELAGDIKLSGSSDSSHTGTGSTSRKGTLAATITCQVQEVLPNGNLRIRGTKQVKVNRETQFLTLDGVVRPRDILLDNTVRSDLIAEARIEFTGAGVLADKQGPGWGTRIADTLWPFQDGAPMDLTSVFAICLSLGFILGGNALEGGHLSSLVQPTAAMIVLGGTFGATWLGATNAELKGLVKLMKRLLRPGLADRAKMLEDILRITTIVRRDGMLAVESQLPGVDDPTLRKALQMLVDGNAGEDVKNVLEMEMDMLEHHGTASAKLLESAGGYSPTIGILGAVLGLIHVMQNLSDPTKLGTGIAVAFVATIYGVGFANLLYLPLGARLKKIVMNDSEDRAMVVAGIGGIVAGANARQMGEMLAPFAGHVVESQDAGAEKDKAAA